MFYIQLNLDPEDALPVRILKMFQKATAVNRVSLKLAAFKQKQWASREAQVPDVSLSVGSKRCGALGATQRDIIMYLANQYSSLCAALSAAVNTRERKKLFCCRREFSAGDYLVGLCDQNKFSKANFILRRDLSAQLVPNLWLHESWTDRPTHPHHSEIYCGVTASPCS